MENNPYAPPKNISDKTYAAGFGDTVLHVEGKDVVSPDEHHWPDRCVICNEPAGGFRLKRKLYWHNPTLYILVIVGVLIYAIVALIARKTGTIYVGLCETHRNRRRNGIILGWGGFFGFIALLIASGSIQGDPTVRGIITGGSLTAIFLCPIIGLVMARVITVRKIRDGYVWVRTGRAFRDSL